MSLTQAPGKPNWSLAFSDGSLELPDLGVHQASIARYHEAPMTNVVPAGWHTVTPRLVVEDPAGLVAFLERVFEAAGELQADAPSQIMPASARCRRSIAGGCLGHALWRSSWNGEGSLGQRLAGGHSHALIPVTKDE